MISAASPASRPHYGWFAVNSIVLATLIFVIVVNGAGPGNGGGWAARLWLTLGLALLPGLAYGLIQAVVLPLAVRGSRMRWVSITVGSAAAGWAIAIGLYMVSFRLAILQIPVTGLRSAILVGITMGSSAGVVVGAVVGRIQTTFAGLLFSQRRWMIATIISWWFGVTAPLTLFFAALSQIRFSF